MGRYVLRLTLGAALTLALSTAALAASQGAARDWLSRCFLTLPPLSAGTSVYQDQRGYDAAQQVFEQTNWWRAKKGLQPVRRNPHLDAVAQAHAIDMAQQGYFEHDSPQGMDVFDRIEVVHCPDWSTGGENIAAGYKTAEIAVKEWMNSKGHRHNLLGERYEYMGVGAYYDPDSEYGWYWVQVFASFRGDPDRHDWLEPGETL